jgi:uncharacterized protein (TIGR02246 family)
MKTRLLRLGALLALTISFTAPTFAQQKDTVDPKTAQQIRALRIKFDEAFNRNDAATVAALYAEDGVWVSLKNGAFHGRQAIERAYAKYEFGPWHPSNPVGRVDRVIAENCYAAATCLRPPLVPFGFTSFSPKRAAVATDTVPNDYVWQSVSS